jgi:DNA replication and repair protein RecF
MQVQTLRLKNFRSHTQGEIHFGSGVNVIYGQNGVGKTNILEALHYVCLTKSFIASKDQYALKMDTDYFEVEGEFKDDREGKLQAKLVFVPNEGKRMFVNRAPLDSLAEIIGRVPLVLFAPNNYSITADGPEERRKFLNNILSQTRPVYLKDLMHYQRVLAQRNALLFSMKRQRAYDQDTLASWNQELVRLGSRIIQARLRFLSEFSVFLADAYQRIEDVGEEPLVEYQTIAPVDELGDEEAIMFHFEKQLEKAERQEKDQGRTLVGAQRDELVFRLNQFEVRRYASQGQHRTFGMALQLAKYFYLQDKLDERPLLLLDDIFGDLDSRRTRIFLDLLVSEHIGQSIITAVESESFSEIINFGTEEHRLIHVEKGGIIS